jgi:hypothetical protein
LRKERNYNEHPKPDTSDEWPDITLTNAPRSVGALAQSGRIRCGISLARGRLSTSRVSLPIGVCSEPSTRRSRRVRHVGRRFLEPRQQRQLEAASLVGERDSARGTVEEPQPTRASSRATARLTPEDVRPNASPARAKFPLSSTAAIHQCRQAACHRKT